MTDTVTVQLLFTPVTGTPINHPLSHKGYALKIVLYRCIMVSQWHRRGVIAVATLRVKNIPGGLCERMKSVAVFLAIICIGVSCSRQDDEAAIRELIEKGAGMAEAHDVSGILGLAVEDLRVMPGNLDGRGVTGILWRAFKYYGPLRVLYPRPDVELAEGGKQAFAGFPFLIVRKEQTLPELEQLTDDPLGWLDEVGKNADLYRLELDLINLDGDWLVKQAILKRFTGTGFRQ